MAKNFMTNIRIQLFALLVGCCPAMAQPVTLEKFDSSSHLRCETAICAKTSQSIVREIKRAWFPPANCEALTIVVIFEMDSQGNVSSPRLEKTVGNKGAEQAAIDAVKNAAPFTSAPDSKTTMQATFDKNLFEEGSRNFNRWW